jgi:hypothetical protein
MMSRRAHTLGVSALRTYRFTRFFVVPLTLIALFSGCTKWATWGGPDVLPHDTDLPKRVRVTYETEAATRVVVLESASVVGDSLVGDALKQRRGFENTYGPTKRLAIPLADITGIESRQKDMRGRIVLASLLTAALAFTIIIVCSSDEAYC